MTYEAASVGTHRWPRGDPLCCQHAIGIVAGGPPPDFGSSSKDVAKYFTDYRAGLQGSFLIGNGLPVVFGAWFFGSLTVALWRAPGEARFGAFIGAVGSAILASVATAVAVIFAILTL
jgi:hypothetical protein